MKQKQNKIAIIKLIAILFCFLFHNRLVLDNLELERIKLEQIKQSRNELKGSS
jgi:hypothetical protein